MTLQDGASATRLSREAEITRKDLAGTVGELNVKVADTIDDLKARLTPSYIKQEVKGYVREESSQIISSIQRKARDNPLQAVAIGAAVIYPFWGIIKSIPLPIFLFGGGIWLSKQKNGKISHTANESADDFVRSMRDAKDSLVANVNAATDTINDTAHGIIENATTAAGATADAIKQTSADARETVSAKVSELKEAGTRIVSHSKTVFEDIVDKNPLFLGGLALALGAFIAASLPISDAENKLFGERSDDVKDKALGAVSEGVERAKDTAANIAGDIAAAAAREGLSAEGLSKTIDGTAVAVKAVVDRGLTTAINGAGTSQSSDASPTELTETSA